MLPNILSRTETRRVHALGTLDPKEQARLGQFFTPERAAALIASLATLPRSGTVRVLDPGAGVGSLTAAVVGRVVSEGLKIRLEITAVEIDERVLPYLRETLSDCESEASAAGVKISTQIVRRDFLEYSDLNEFDLVVMNPPYAKLGASSPHRRAMLDRGVDCPNIYAAFMTQGLDALREGGQLVAITPRSFANGPYFGQFRQHLLANLAIDRLHTFASRSTVFSDTGVLQENIVLAGTKGGTRGSVTVSTSVGHLDEATATLVPYESIVIPGDPHQFLRIAADGTDTLVAEAMEAMPATLGELGLEVSTGRVVDFRSRESLRATPDEECAPLVYPGNLRGGVVVWPTAIRKPQGFAVSSAADRKLLLPPGCYVVVKRFSAKEERRRIVAAVWDPAAMGGVSVAFENHLNVFHQGGSGIDRSLAVGLSLWLNSSLVDRFFRTFSGHTQVNATDLRSLRFPSLSELTELGTGRDPLLPDQNEIDTLVASLVERPGQAA